MSQPVKLSDEIVLDARLTAEIAERSIAGRAGTVPPLAECLASVDSDDGRQRVRVYLNARPFPHYEPAPDSPGLLVRIDEDGIRTLGRFVGRAFHAAK